MTDMTAADVLREARDLIATPHRWTQDVLARDKDGRVEFPDSPAACRWCAEGAYIAASSRNRTRAAVDGAAHRALWSSARKKGYQGPADFNDDPDTTHADILALYDDAIHRAAA